MDLMDYRRKIIANSPHLASASGAAATFSDGDDLLLKSLNVDIEPVQSGSGDPSPDNVRPISGWNGVKVTRCGKNLFGGDAWFGRGGTENREARTITSGSALETIPLLGNLDGYSFKENTTYTLIVTMTTTATNGRPCFGFKYTDGTTSYLKNTDIGSAKGTYAFASDPSKTLRAIERASYTGTKVYYVDECGVFVGALDVNDFVPYNGVAVTIDLGQTVYGGTLNPLTGVLTVDRRFLVLSSSGSGTYGYNSRYGQLRITGLNAMSNTVENICSHYKSFSGSFANLPDKSFMASSSTIAIKDSDYTSLESWKAYLDAQLSANTPVQVCVILQAEEVETIQLTPHQVRSLYGSNTIFADTGNIALEYWAHP